MKTPKIRKVSRIEKIDPWPPGCGRRCAWIGAVAGSSAISSPSTRSIASAPATTPPGMSPPRNRGRITPVMIVELMASVSVPSSPYPTSILTFRSVGATRRIAPVFLPFCPMPQARPS
jgi:hypothetical protein